MNEHELQQIRAIDVESYFWALPCTIGDSETINVVDIVGRQWSTDGKQICFLLDSHNVFLAPPEKMLELVPLVPACKDAEWFKIKLRKEAEAMKEQRPCPTCKGTGKW